jgi:hypothetical protein
MGGIITLQKSVIEAMIMACIPKSITNEIRKNRYTY